MDDEAILDQWCEGFAFGLLRPDLDYFDTRNAAAFIGWIIALARAKRRQTLGVHAGFGEIRTTWFLLESSCRFDNEGWRVLGVDGAAHGDFSSLGIDGVEPQKDFLTRGGVGFATIKRVPNG